MPTGHGLLQPGDVLVQYRGEPWVTCARLIIGRPYPHARVVSRADTSGVWIIEDGKPFGRTLAGVNEYLLPDDLDSFEVWRPNCDATTKTQAVEWMRQHVGQLYDYGRMAEIVLLRGHFSRGEIDGFDDETYDGHPMVCSELIARGYWRAGYDLVPVISNRATMPWDLRNPLTCTRVLLTPQP
jgi:hypothetical protein